MKKRNLAVLLLWAVLTGAAWLLPAREVSQAERRPLAQMPAISGQTILNGKFMTGFEKYSLDQFPLRDGFRTIKSLFHFYGLHQLDNNGIYLAKGYAVKQEYPANADSVAHALERLTHLYEKYLQDSRVSMAIVPDKGYYLQDGHLRMDYDRFYADFAQGLPWAQQIDLRECLSLEDYYRTDIHWRQEKLAEAAAALCQGGASGPGPGAAVSGRASGWSGQGCAAYLPGGEYLAGDHGGGNGGGAADPPGLPLPGHHPGGDGYGELRRSCGDDLPAYGNSTVSGGNPGYSAAERRRHRDCGLGGGGLRF